MMAVQNGADSALIGNLIPTPEVPLAPKATEVEKQGQQSSTPVSDNPQKPVVVVETKIGPEYSERLSPPPKNRWGDP